MANNNANENKIPTLEFNGPLEFKGSLTEDDKRYLVDMLYLTPKDRGYKS